MQINHFSDQYNSVIAIATTGSSVNMNRSIQVEDRNESSFFLRILNGLTGIYTKSKNLVNRLLKRNQSDQLQQLDQLEQQLRSIIENVDSFEQNNANRIECQLVFDKNNTKVIGLDITITDKIIDAENADAILKDLQNLGLPVGSVAIDFSDCKNLTGLEIDGISTIKSINLSGCSNLQGLRISNIPYLTLANVAGCSQLNCLILEKVPYLASIDLTTCDLVDTVVVEDCHNKDLGISINSDCKLIQDREFNRRDDRRLFNVKAKWALLLDKPEDVKTVRNIINSVRNKFIAIKNSDSGAAVEFNNFLKIIKDYSSRCSLLSGQEREKATEKYLHAMYDVREHLTTCIDACRTGISHLKVALTVGAHLAEAKTVAEKINLIFAEYVQERIEKSLDMIDKQYQNQSGGTKVKELLELKLLIGIVLGVSNNSGMTFRNTADQVISNIINSLAGKLEGLSIRGMMFLSRYSDIEKVLEGKVAAILGKDRKSRLTVPLNMVLTSMLKDSNDQTDQTFVSYLLSNDEYVKHLLPPTPSSDELLKMTIDQLQERIGLETEEIRLTKQFLTSNIGKRIDPDGLSSDRLKSNSTLEDIFAFADNCYNGEEGLDERIYKVIGDLTTTAFVEKQSKIIFKKQHGFDTDVNYKQTLAQHFRRLLKIQR